MYHLGKKERKKSLDNKVAYDFFFESSKIWGSLYLTNSIKKVEILAEPMVYWVDSISPFNGLMSGFNISIQCSLGVSKEKLNGANICIQYIPGCIIIFNFFEC